MEFRQIFIIDEHQCVYNIHVPIEVHVAIRRMVVGFIEGLKILIG